MGNSEKMDGFKRLDRFVRAVEQNCELAARLPELVARENAISKSQDGRSFFDDRMKKPPVPAKKQLSLFYPPPPPEKLFGPHGAGEFFL